MVTKDKNSRNTNHDDNQQNHHDTNRELSFLSDVPLHVSVELGRSNLRIKDLIQLQKGSVIELDKLAGEPLEILVNGRDVARGEVVVMNEKFGIRLTDIINPFDHSNTSKTNVTIND